MLSFIINLMNDCLFSISSSFFPNKKTKQITKRNLRNSTQKLNKSKLKDELDCNIVAHMKKTRNSSQSHTNGNSVLSNCDSGKNNLPPKKENTRMSKEIGKKYKNEKKHKTLPDLIGKNGLPDEKIFNELLEEVNLSQV